MIDPAFEVRKVFGGIGGVFVKNNLNIFVRFIGESTGGLGRLCTRNIRSPVPSKRVLNPSGNEQNDGTIMGRLNVLHCGGNTFAENTVVGRAQDNKNIVFCRETKHEMNE